jgi:hypothetical protein
VFDVKLKEALDTLPTDQLQEFVEYAQRLIEKRSNPGPEEAKNARAGSFDRTHERFDCTFQATFIRHMAPPHQTTGKMNLYEAIVKDISQGGLCMYTETQLESGEVLTIFLKSDARVEKKLFVEVRYTENVGPHFKVGAKFVPQTAVIAAERARLMPQQPR